MSNTHSLLFGETHYLIRELENTCIYDILLLEHGLELRTDVNIVRIRRASQGPGFFVEVEPHSWSYKVKDLPCNSLLPEYAAPSNIISVIATTNLSRGVPARGEPGCFSVILTGDILGETYVLEYYGSDETEIGAIAWMKPSKQVSPT